MDQQTQATTDYLGAFQYQDGALDFIAHAEGYVKAVHTGETTEYHYVYNYTDHLGNIRLSYGRDPETNEVAILKENHYYPFGLKHKGYVSEYKIFNPIARIGKVALVPVRNYLDDSYRYTFGGKEEQPELGLNWMDFHARNYMPDLGRTMTMDPLADEFISISPYSFLNNNPLNNIDPTGAFAIELSGAAARDFFERLKNAVNSKREKKREEEEGEEEEDRLLFDFEHKGYDCNGCPSTYRHKNREVITNQEDGMDYLLYDNQWHELPEQKVFEVFYPDPEHPKGGMTLTRTREELFIESYVSRTVNYSFFKGALSVGTVTGIVEGIKKPFKRSPLFAILAGAEESFRNAKSLFDRMKSHDQEVEHNLNSTKK